MLGQITYLSYKIAITDVIATSEAAREALTARWFRNHKIKNKETNMKVSASF
jgi:hypothetical protein